MKKPVTITAVVGTYREGGTIDQAVDLVLRAAEQAGAHVAKINLKDLDLRFCTNCRVCTQAPGNERGACVLPDDMGGILDRLDRSDAIILASPMNFGTVTALTKAFIERLICYAYWPWGATGPKLRQKNRGKRALLVASSAAPAFLGKRSGSMIPLMRNTAKTLGATKPVGLLFIGLSAGKARPNLGWLTRRKARCLGRKLARR
ncbi:MAG: flavodoxin family protein [Thermodesulfobacteriota bacterium]